MTGLRFRTFATTRIECVVMTLETTLEPRRMDKLEVKVAPYGFTYTRVKMSQAIYRVVGSTTLCQHCKITVLFNHVSTYSLANRLGLFSRLLEHTKPDLIQ